MTIAIIGAGMAGLTCLDYLNRAGRDAVVFDKGRSLGGRLSTHRREGHQFDHGAQYITARDPGFAEFLSGLSSAHWQPTPAPAKNWLVGTPAMNALLKPLADARSVHTGVTVTKIDHQDGSWLLTTDQAPGRQGPYSHVVCTAPAPQTRTLLGNRSAAIAAACDRARYAPCWALMLALPADPAVPDHWREDHPVLGWVARDNAKPDRPAAHDRWVIHANPDWSEHYLEVDRDAAAQMLEQSFKDLFGLENLPALYRRAHRWRYALVEQAAGAPVVRDDSLLAAGDWCLGPRVEFAYQSGKAAADAILSGA